MTVVAFVSRPPPASGLWHSSELEQMKRAVAPALASGRVSAFELGATELGDPQFYLMGPAPVEECELCVSRIGTLYVLHDGEGRLLFDCENLTLLAERAAAALRRYSTRLVARVMLAWCATRQFMHDKMEPVLEEGEDLLTHVAPQFVALA